MGNKIAHRGPDASGEYLDEQIGLCHRRLSIIDLSSAGNQPMISRNGDYVLVFNGEIYNFPELRLELQAKGYAFRTKTDTEVILGLYEQQGTDFLSKLNGMFAFALWDKKKSSLFLARDRLGKKPLYYYNDGKNFVFASEIKAILQVPLVPREVCHHAIYDYFTYQYIPDPKTIFQNIYKLRPGHWMLVDQEGVKQGEYWDVSFQSQSQKSQPEIAEELYVLLEESVRRRMISDVPLGAFLSGGIDSSGVVGLMANNSDQPVTTCAIGFDSKKFDEVKYAQVVADKFNTNHYEFTVRENVEQQLEHIASFFDEPFSDPSLVPTYFVSKLARQKVKVALAGDGGDENFAGYEKYAIDNIENRLRRVFPPFIRNSLFPTLARTLSHGENTLANRGNSLLKTLSSNPAYGFFLTNSFFEDSLWNSLINEDFRRKLGDYHPSSITEGHYHNAATDDHLSKILYTDIKTYLPGDILVKVDRMSMANSLEVRAPILDYRVVEFAATIPSALKYNRGEKKYILKESLKGLLPHDILYRKKMGFSVPLAQWLRHEIREFAESRLFQPNNGVSQFFIIQELKKVWQSHQCGERDYSGQLWSMLMFELWWQNYMASIDN